MKLEIRMTHPFSYLSFLLLYTSCCPCPPVILVALALPLKSGSLCPRAPGTPATLEIPLPAAVEWPRSLGRWSPMQEVQSSIPRRGYIPHVIAAT